MEPREVREKLRSQTERVRLNFLIAEVETARMFAVSAQTYYRIGSKEHAQRVTELAWKAFREAAARFSELPTGHSARRDLSDRLNQIREILEGLPPRPRVVRKGGKQSVKPR